MKREKIHGFLVNFDETLKNTGIYYLQYDLNSQAARTLFEAARAEGEAHFEDDHERRFTLIFNRSDGTYNLEAR
ncbi:MAG: hypothetical protein WD889_01420 [Candidatus Colwellbacteria bacterium]